MKSLCELPGRSARPLQKMIKMNIYITDGTENGFYSAAFFACTDKHCIITSSSNWQIPLGANIVCDAPDESHAERVRKKLCEYDRAALRDISLLLRRGSDTREMTALEYLRLIVKTRGPVRDMLAQPAVLEATAEIKKVTLEAHRFTGFLRFMEGESGVFYAPFSPDNDILELIVPHFIRRLKTQPFVIHDTSRKTAALWNTRECLYTSTDEKVNICLSEYEQTFQNLWKEYYRSVNIQQRPHEKQMKGYMPVRYWKYMPEKHGSA